MVIAVLNLASVALAGDPPPKLGADLIHVKDYSIHVVMEDEEDLLGYRYARVSKAKVLQRVKSPCGILREPIFDVASFMISNGLVMPPGSHAIFSPSSELIYIESTASDLDFARTALSPGPAREHYLFSMDVVVSLKSADKTEVLLETKSMPFNSGQRMEFGSAGEGHVRLVLEPVIGPDGDAFDAGMEVDIQAHGKSLKKDLTKLMHHSKPEDVELGMLGDAIVTLHLQTHLEVDYFGPPALETDAKKAAAIEEIEKALHTPSR